MPNNDDPDDLDPSDLPTAANVSRWLTDTFASRGTEPPGTYVAEPDGDRVVIRDYFRDGSESSVWDLSLAAARVLLARVELWPRCSADERDIIAAISDAEWQVDPRRPALIEKLRAECGMGDSGWNATTGEAA